jgi:hypothetical protein
MIASYQNLIYALTANISSVSVEMFYGRVSELQEIRSEGVESIHLIQYRDQWRALVNTEMKLRVP